jgi:hypothetical protein
MVIQGEFYQLIPVDESSLFFDLKLLHKVGGKNPREEYKEAGYGLTLDSALKKCINYAINQNFEVLSLKEYLDEFRRLTTEIGLQIQGKPIQFN